MIKKLLDALTEIYGFYTYAYSKDYLLNAVLNFKLHEIHSDKYSQQEWTEIQDLYARAAMIPDACQNAYEVLISDTRFPQGFRRGALDLACENLKVVQESRFKAHKALLEDSIKRLRACMPNPNPQAPNQYPFKATTPATAQTPPPASKTPPIPKVLKRHKVSRRTHEVYLLIISDPTILTYEYICAKLQMGKGTVRKALKELGKLQLLPKQYK